MTASGNPPKFTLERVQDNMIELYCDGEWLADLDSTQGAAMGAVLAFQAPLPDGVRWEMVSCLGEVPVGWEWSDLLGKWYPSPVPGGPHSSFSHIVVRPSDSPIVELVPWSAAFGRTFHNGSGWATITSCIQDENYPNGAVICDGVPFPATADGMVEVLVES